MTALNLLEKSVKPGQTETIIEYSSGSTVISMSLVARVYYGLPDVRAYLSNKTSETKLRLMQFFGLDITLFGGPSQPEPEDERGGIKAAERMAKESDGVVNPNQYENDNVRPLLKQQEQMLTILNRTGNRIFAGPVLK